jgi:type I restriction enzyme S subunit
MKAGWQQKTLDQIADNLDSRRVPITKSDRANGPYPYYGASGIVDYVSDYIFDFEALLISEDGANLLARSTPVAFSVSGKYWVNNHAHVLKFADSRTQQFVEFYFQSIKLDEYIRGAAQPKLTQNALNSIPIPFPPLPEQQRIVGILDEAFDGIATAKANAEKNLQNARALFESHLQAVFTHRGEGWVERRLEELVDAKCSLSYGIVQPGGEYPNGLPIVRPTDLTTKVIQLNGLKRIDPVLAGGYRRTELTGGELLLCVRGSTGVVSIASEELADANVTRGIVPIRFDESHVIQGFGYYVLTSGLIQKQIRQKTYGAALMQINIRDLRNIVLPFPLLSEQERFTAKLDSLSAQTQRLESIYRQKLAALDALKKSLLDQAFTGVL